MQPTYEDACKAIRPYFDTFADHFIQELKDGVFMGDESAFIKAKHKIEIITAMKQILINQGEE